MDGIREVISKATQEAIKIYGDSATQIFYNFMKEKKFKTTKCMKCGNVDFPPRKFCSNCYSEDIEWIDIPEKGKILAFTTQKRAIRFSEPDIIGFVELDGIGRILTKIEGENLNIGETVYLDFVESDGIILHKFVKK